MSLKVITPKGILSYPYLFEPQADKKGNLKYSCAILFDSEADLKALNDAVLEAAEEKWGAKAGEMLLKGKLNHPIRKDVEEKGYPEGIVAFFNARSKAQPGIVSIFPGPNGKPLPITDPKEIYPGCQGRISVTAFSYDVEGNKGVGFALNNVQKMGEGERIDGRKKAEDEFDADLTAKPASIDDL